MSEKQEPATPLYLKKAKAEGRVNKSQECTSFALIFAVLLMVTFAGRYYFMQIKALFLHCWYLLNVPLEGSTSIALIQLLISKIVGLWLPFVVVLLIALVLSSVIQTGWVFTLKPLQFQLKRLHPLAGLKGIFSTKVYYQIGKAVFMWISLVLFFIYIIEPEASRFVQLRITAKEISVLQELAWHLFLPWCLLIGAFAFLDKFYTRWKFIKDHRMSKEEIKEEVKEREGSLFIKGKRQEWQWQFRKKIHALRNIHQATILVVEAEATAVALTYRKESMPAPQVVYLGRGNLAKKAREWAKRFGIPIVENPVAASLLYAKSKLYHWIEPEHYGLVASLLQEGMHAAES